MTNATFPKVPKYVPAASEPSPLARFGMSADKPSSEGAKMTGQNLPAYFQFEGSPVRHAVDMNGNPWFVLDDVCGILEIKNTSDAAERLDADERAGIAFADTSSSGTVQRRNFLCVSESGLYTIILRSHSALQIDSVAHRFRKWVTGVVLPSIRKTGGYGNQVPARSLLEEIIADPQKASAAIAAQAKTIAELSSQNVGLATDLHHVKDINERFKHGLNSLMALMAEPGGMCLRDAANQLGQPQHAFNIWLKDKGWIYKNERAQGKKSRWKPHAWAIAEGILGDKDWIRNKITSEVTLYTPEMGFINPNDYFTFKEVEVTKAGMVKILQYEDFPNPHSYSIQITRKKFGVTK